MLADLVQPHLVVDGSKPQQAGRPPERDEVVFVSDAVPAVDLNGVIGRLVRRLAREPLGGVREAGRVRVLPLHRAHGLVVERAGRTQLGPEPRERMLHRLVATDRSTERGPVAGIADRPRDAVKAKTVRERGDQQPLGVQRLEQRGGTVSRRAPRWPGPDRVAVVAIAKELVPASGSVIAKASRRSPATIGGTSRAAVSGSAWRGRTGRQSSVMMKDSSGIPAAPISSATATTASSELPPPPRRSGTAAPTYPALHSSRQSASGSRPSR